MARRMIKWSIKVFLALLAISILFFLFRTIIFKKDRIEKLTYIDLPETANIIDYSIDISLTTGVQLDYAKVKIDRETYYAINGPSHHEINDNNKFMHHVLLNNSNKPDLTSAEEFKCCDLLSSAHHLFLAATTRVTYYVATKETNGDYFLYFYTAS